MHAIRPLLADDLFASQSPYASVILRKQKIWGCEKKVLKGVIEHSDRELEKQLHIYFDSSLNIVRAVT
jgi:hypothetical protein